MLNLTYLLLIVWVYAQLHNCVQTSATTWIVAHQASLSTRSSRQGYWNGLPFPPPGALPADLASPVLTDGFFTTVCTT